jgi:hypothetical protein
MTASTIIIIIRIIINRGFSHQNKACGGSRIVQHPQSHVGCPVDVIHC